MNYLRLQKSALRNLHTRVLTIFVALIALSGCAGKTVTVEIPPMVDLKTWPVIGIVDFAAETHPDLAPAATQKFMIQMQGSQRGVRMLELGSTEQVLRAVDRHTLDPEAIKAIGSKYGVAAVLLGTLDVSEARPNIDFGADLKSISAKASVTGALSAKLQETSTGATVWTNGAHGQYTLARMSLSSAGLSNVGISTPSDRYDQMLRDLAKVATNDFRPRYEKRRVED